MLNFKVENYRTFGPEQSLSMQAGQVRNLPEHVTEVLGRKVQHSAAVFGGISSGKSNMVSAIRESREMVVFGKPLPHDCWNRSSPDNSGRTTGFEYTFESGGMLFGYGFEVMAATSEVRSEWLYALPNGQVAVFEREDGRTVSGIDGDPDLEVLDILSRACPREYLLLPMLAGYCDPKGMIVDLAREAHSWFRDRLAVSDPDGTVPVGNRGDRSSIVRDVMTSYLSGVDDVVASEVDLPGASTVAAAAGLMPGQSVVLGDADRTTVIRLEDGSVEATRCMVVRGSMSSPLSGESDGVRRVFDLIPLLDPGEGRGRVFVVDDLEGRMHPLVTSKLLEDFHRCASAAGRQLVFTTGDCRLLDHDKFRRDEMWFADRGRGSTELYSLEHFRERGDRRVDMAYLSGRYGAAPKPMSIHEKNKGGPENGAM